MPLNGIDCNLFAEWCGYTENMTGIDNLITMGLINENDDGVLFLHPLTKAAFLHKAPPQLINCSKLLWSIYHICIERYDITPNYQLIFNITDNILSDIEKPPASDENFYRYFLLNTYYTEDFYIHFLMDVYRNMDVYKHHSGQKMIIHELSRLLKGTYKNNIHCKTIYYLYAADYEPNLNKRVHIYEYALDCCALLPPTIENRLLESNIYASCASALLMQNDLHGAQSYLYRAIELRATTEYKLNPDGVKQLQHYYFISALLGNENESIEALKEYEVAMKESNLSGYASIHETIGLIYICQSNEEVGKKHLAEAFDIYRQIYENSQTFISEKCQEIKAIYHKFHGYMPNPTAKVYDLNTLKPIDE